MQINLMVWSAIMGGAVMAIFTHTWRAGVKANKEIILTITLLLAIILVTQGTLS